MVVNKKSLMHFLFWQKKCRGSHLVHDGKFWPILLHLGPLASIAQNSQQLWLWNLVWTFTMIRISFQAKINLNLDYNIQYVAIWKIWNFNWLHSWHLRFNKSKLQLSTSKTKQILWKSDDHSSSYKNLNLPTFCNLTNLKKSGSCGKHYYKGFLWRFSNIYTKKTEWVKALEFLKRFLFIILKISSF